jgi:transposase-like protein
MRIKRIVKIVQDSNESLSVVSDELGVHYKKLSCWVRASMKDNKSPSKSNDLQKYYEALLTEHAKLKGKLKRTEQSREILKKAQNI